MKILIVCSGNTCRSPMAAAILRDLLSRAGKGDIEVSSAGAAAYPGMGASPEAVRVMREQGLCLAGHRSRLLTPDMVAEADLILTMDRGQVQAVRGLGGGEKVKLLSTSAGEPEVEIVDPYGSGIAAYRFCADEITGYLQRLAAEL